MAWVIKDAHKSTDEERAFLFKEGSPQTVECVQGCYGHSIKFTNDLSIGVLSGSAITLGDSYNIDTLAVVTIDNLSNNDFIHRVCLVSEIPSKEDIEKARQKAIKEMLLAREFSEHHTGVFKNLILY